MDITALDAEINERIQELQNYNKQMGEIAQKIQGLQAEGQALHSAALEVKGAVEGLAKLKAKEEAKAKEVKDKLILVDKSLVAADGKTVIVDVNQTPAAPSEPVAPAAEAPAATEPDRNEDGSLKFPLEVVK